MSVSGIDARLIDAAREAARTSYSPYSGFAVGAALLVSDGRVFLGANVENCSYGLTICAERVAMFRAVTEGARSFRRMAIVTHDGRPALPCGACRQVLAEFAPRLRLVLWAKRMGVRRLSLARLLPLTFRPSHLGARLRVGHGRAPIMS
jgi:cytidine deaminase